MGLISELRLSVTNEINKKSSNEEYDSLYE